MAEASADLDPAGLAGSPLDVVVVGAGLIGLATAMALLKERPALRLAVVEKEASIASHQSGHNSGVIHAGLYYKPGSLKARFCSEGRKALAEFADSRGIPYLLSGKLVVASDESELGRFGELAERGRANGLALRELKPAEFAELEPNVRGVRALHVPESGVIDYRRVAAAYAEVVAERGGAVLCGREVRAITDDGGNGGYRRLVTGAETFTARAVISCAGLQSDRVTAMTGHAPGEYRIVPFRGDYYTFKPHAAGLVRRLVYPVPDPGFPFLGVHFTRGIDGTLHAGPNAVPSFAREGYRRFSFDRRDFLEILRFPGFRRLARSYAATGAREIWRDLVKRAFVADMRRYLPMVGPDDVTFGPSGVRAQCLSRSGALVDDFLIEESGSVVHVLNAPSPAATASLVIGRHCAARAIERFGL
jgi:(S)-2-hydroxyglutarate dehydrogenase